MSCEALLVEDEFPVDVSDLTPSSAPPRPDPSRLAAFATVLARVKPFPLAVQQVRAIAGAPSSTVVDVARALEQDVGLTTDVLRIVNAPVSGLAQRCTSVRHAVALLGLDRVSNVVAGAAALAFVEGASAVAPSVAAHSIAVAGVARMLASYTGTSPDEAFVAGLLHDVGVMLLLQENDYLYEELVEQAGAAEVSLEEERALLGFDHASAGAHAMRAWRLPSPLPDAVQLHHSWNNAVEVGGATLALVAVVRTADALVPRLLENETPTSEDLDLARTEPAFACIGLSREELHNMWGGLRLACSKAHVINPGRDFIPAVLPKTTALRTTMPPAEKASSTSWGLVAVAAVVMAVAYFVWSAF